MTLISLVCLLLLLVEFASMLILKIRYRGFINQLEEVKFELDGKITALSSQVDMIMKFNELVQKKLDSSTVTGKDSPNA